MVGLSLSVSLATLSAEAARLIPGKTEIAVGETILVILEAEGDSKVEWVVSPGLVIVEADGQGAAVKAIKAGPASVTARHLGQPVKVNLQVSAVAAEPPNPPHTDTSARPAVESAGGIVLAMAVPWANRSGEIFRVLQDMAAHGEVTKAQARILFQRMLMAAPGENVWWMLREAKQANRGRWDEVRPVERQLAVLLGDSLLAVREQALRETGLSGLFAIHDSGAWSDGARQGLDLDADFETALFFVQRADDAQARLDRLTDRIDRLMREQFGVEANQLGLAMTAYVHDPVADRFVSPSGVAWTPPDAEAAKLSRLHLVDPESGRQGPRLAGLTEALLARQTQFALRQRLPALFDGRGRSTARANGAEVRAVLLAETGLVHGGKPPAKTRPDERLADAALTLIDAASQLAGWPVGTDDPRTMPGIARLVAIAGRAFEEAMPDDAWKAGLSPAELDLLRLARDHDAAWTERVVVEAEIDRFMEDRPEPTAWTTAETARLRQRLERAGELRRAAESIRTQLSQIQMSQPETGRGWPAAALAVTRKLAGIALDQALDGQLALANGDRRRALAGLGQDLGSLIRLRQGRGAGEEPLAWARAGLDAATLLRDLADEPRFGELSAAYLNTASGKARPTKGELERLKAFLARSEAGRQLWPRLAAALDRLARSPDDAAVQLMHPLADALRQLRDDAVAAALIDRGRLLVGLPGIVRQGGNDVAMARELAAVLAATETRDLILKPGRSFEPLPDDPSARRLLAYLLAPEGALPALIDAIARPPAESRGAAAPEPRLDPLRPLAGFDERGTLLRLGGHDRERLPGLLADLLGANGERVLAELFLRTQDVDPATRTALMRQLRATLERGEPQLFKDDATLAGLLANMRDYSLELDTLAGAFGVDPRDEGQTARLDPDQRRVLALLQSARDGWRGQARQRFLADLVNGLEQAQRADMTQRARYAMLATGAAIRVAPAVLTVGDDFTAGIALPPDSDPRGARWIWRASGDLVGNTANKPGDGIETTEAAGISIRAVARGSGALHARLVDPDGKPLAELSVPVLVSPRVSMRDFSARVPDNWRAEPIEQGIRFVRSEAKTRGACGRDTVVGASLTASFKAGAMDDVTLRNRVAETLAELDRQRGERPAACALPVASPAKPFPGRFGEGGENRLTLGEYSGGLVDFPVWSAAGDIGNPGNPGNPAALVACGNGRVLGKPGGIEFSYRVEGEACAGDGDRPYLVRQALAARKEAGAIVASLGLDGTGIERLAYAGPKYDGADLPGVKLRPLPRLKLGERATLAALVENAEPEDLPLTYTWGGDIPNQGPNQAADGKAGERIEIRPERSGRYTVRVAVDGQRYRLGEASLDYAAAEAKVRIEPAAAGKPFLAGGKAGFKARLSIDGRPAEGEYVYRWRADPALKLDVPEGSAAETTATLGPVGRYRLAVEVLERRGDERVVLAESEPVEIDVIRPRLALSVEPGQPMVGQGTRVTAKFEPALDEATAAIRWSHQGEAHAPAAAGERIYGFKPLNGKPVTVTAQARLRDGDVELGQTEVVVQPRTYGLKLGEPRHQGDKPRLWVCDSLGEKAGEKAADKRTDKATDKSRACALREVADGRLAVRHDLTVRAQVDPAPAGAHYLWTVSPAGHCGTPGDSAELRLNCGDTGRYAIGLRLHGEDGILLGEAAGMIEIGIGEAELIQAERSRQAEDKMQQAVRLAGQDRLDEAIQLAGEAAGLDRDHPDAVRLRDRWLAVRQDIAGLIESAGRSMEGGQYEVAQRALDAAQAHPRYPALVDARKRLDDLIEAREARRRETARQTAAIQAHLRADRLAEAAGALPALRGLDAEGAGALARELMGRAAALAAQAEGRRDYAGASRLYGISLAVDSTDAASRRGADNAAANQRRLDELRARQQEVAGRIDTGAWPQAEAGIADLQRMEAGLPGPLSTESQALVERFRTGLAAYQQGIEKARGEIVAALAVRRLDDARERLATLRQRQQFPAELDWIKARSAELDTLKAEAAALLTTAKGLWVQSRHGEAVAQAEAAARLDPAAAAPLLVQYGEALSQLGQEALLRADYPTALSQLELAVHLLPADREAARRLDLARRETAQWRQAEARIKEFDGHLAARRLVSAQRLMPEIQSLLKGLSSGQSADHPAWKRLLDAHGRAAEEYDRFVREANARHAQSLAAEDFGAVLRNAEAMVQRELAPADEAAALSRIDLATRRLRADESVAQAKALVSQGQYDQALAILLQVRESDPRAVEATIGAFAADLKRQAAAAESRRDFAAAGRFHRLALAVAPADTDIQRGLERAVAQQGRMNELRTRQQAVAGLIGNKGAGTVDWPQVEAGIADLRRIESGLPGPLSAESQGLIERFQQGRAASLLESAKGHWAQARHADAVAQTEAAARLDPATAAPLLTQYGTALKQLGQEALLRADYPAALSQLELAARLLPADPEAARRLELARREAAQWREAEARIKEFDGHLAARRLVSAQGLMPEIQSLLKGLSSGEAPDHPAWKRLIETHARAAEEYERFVREAGARHAQAIAAEDYEAVLRNAEAMTQRELAPADAEEARARLGLARRNLDAAQLAQKAVEHIGQGRLDQALATLLDSRAINPKATEAATRTLVVRARELAVQAEGRRDYADAARLYGIAQTADPADAEARRGADNAAANQRRLDELNARRREVAGYLEKGIDAVDWRQAEAAIAELKQLEVGLPGPLSAETQALVERFEKGQAAYRQAIEKERNEIAAALAARRLDEARARLAALRQRQLTPADQEWTNARSAELGDLKANAAAQLEAAKGHWTQARHADAIDQAEAAARLDPAAAAPVLTQYGQALKQLGQEALLRADYPTALSQLELAARLLPADREVAQRLELARREAAQWPQVEARIKEFDGHLAARRIVSAQPLIPEIQSLLRGLSTGQSPDNPVWKRLGDAYAQAVEEYNRFVQDAGARHAQALAAEDFAAMLRNAEAMTQRELAPADAKEVQSRIALAKHHLRAAELANQASALTRQGQYKEALAAIAEGRAIHPGSVKAAAGELAEVLKRLAGEADAKRDFKTAGRWFELALDAAPEDQEARNGAAKVAEHLRRSDELRVWQRETEGHMALGAWDKAAARLEDIKRAEALMPGEMYPDTKALIQRQEIGLATYQADVEPRKQEIDGQIGAACLDDAREGLMTMRALQLVESDRDWARVAQGRIDQAQLACQTKAARPAASCGACPPAEPAPRPAAAQTAAAPVPPPLDMPNIQQQVDEMVNLLEQMKDMLNK